MLVMPIPPILLMPCSSSSSLPTLRASSNPKSASLRAADQRGKRGRRASRGLGLALPGADANGVGVMEDVDVDVDVDADTDEGTTLLQNDGAAVLRLPLLVLGLKGLL
ncbi:uncharacterized protein K441DRAFT_683203 [Cenococcum geophilum 1.58]|uniref:Uncharacterized protein n=1 Tax=Cenococcum geophilum 1.58 TaxID=794803 RepID=A0ACC8EKG4_9PEZI|nr:hypothetical protein K441DRAFT_683203 [Cenococcum geophilum 1.58]